MNLNEIPVPDSQLAGTDLPFTVVHDDANGVLYASPEAFAVLDKCNIFQVNEEGTRYILPLAPIENLPDWALDALESA